MPKVKVTIKSEVKLLLKSGLSDNLNNNSSKFKETSPKDKAVGEGE